jgi:phosphohistidine swiveling domain-containing protein
MDRRDSSDEIELQGRGTSPGIACGPLARNDARRSVAQVAGRILVADRAVPEDVQRILAASGTLTLGGAMLSHISLLSREFGKPSVALTPEHRARLLEPGSAGLLDLGDLVGHDGETTVIDEGDVVLLDGDRGRLRVPGGVNRDRRRRVRELFVALTQYGADPVAPGALATLIRAASQSSAIGFLLDAALVCRIVPAGEASRTMIEALSASDSTEELVTCRRRLVESITDETARRCRRATDEIRRTGDPDELAARRERLRAVVEWGAGVLVDLEAPVDTLRDALVEIESKTANKLEALRRKLLDGVVAAVALGDETLRRRLGPLRRLLTRARTAKLKVPELDRLDSRVSRQLGRERARAGARLLLTLDSGVPLPRSLVGGKAAGLLEVARCLPDDCVLPRGFVVTTTAYKLHLLGEAGEKLQRAVEADRDEIELARQARGAILGGPIPEDVSRAVATALAELGDVRLAVRSSCTIEDSSVGSLAGLFDTYLGVRGEAALLDRIRWTWASLWNLHALRLLAGAGRAPLLESQAVLVQQMIPTRTAGVMFSRDPARRADNVLVNAAWGLGEAISQGEVSGHLFWLRRSTGELVASELGRLERKVVLDPERRGTVSVDLAPEEQARPCLDAQQLKRLARLARSLEEGTGIAQDVEFGFDASGVLHVFQARPVVAARLAQRGG